MSEYISPETLQEQAVTELHRIEKLLSSNTDGTITPKAQPGNP